MKTITFKNDDNVSIKLIEHEFTKIFQTRDNHEVLFRRIHTYLIKNKIIHGNVIDLGAWMGDNSIPWALNLKHTIYSIDPSPNNIEYIEKMAKQNNISNIKTIKSAISDKNQILWTNDNINHCEFKIHSGRTKVESVTLDYLYSQGVIDNIKYIHLDVEGFEFNVIKGSENIINIFNPIISFEQHINTDNYIELSNHLKHKRYDVFLINEQLPGCKPDCRNFLAFPTNLKIDVNQISENIVIDNNIELFKKM